MHARPPPPAPPTTQMAWQNIAPIPNMDLETDTGSLPLPAVALPMSDSDAYVFLYWDLVQCSRLRPHGEREAGLPSADGQSAGCRAPRSALLCVGGALMVLC